jgi:hypothetical protein
MAVADFLASRPGIALTPDDFPILATDISQAALAVAREGRLEATSRVEGALLARRGDILDFKTFSNVSLNLLVEVDAAALVGIADELRGLDWPVDLDPPREALLARAGERIEGTLLLDFPDGDGELVIPLPRVPG